MPSLVGRPCRLDLGLRQFHGPQVTHNTMER